MAQIAMLAATQTNLEKRTDTMKAEMDDGCTCPRCNDHIAVEFYCRQCGYVPNWRKMESEHYEVCREAA